MASYKKLLQQGRIGYNRWPSSQCRFALIYIDNDEIPELLLYSTYSGTSNGYYDLFSYRKGKAVRLECGLGTNFFYYKKKGVFGSKFWLTLMQGGPGDRMAYYRMSNGKVDQYLEWMRLDPSTVYNRTKTKYTYSYSKTGKYSQIKNISVKKYKEIKKKFISSAKQIKNNKIKFYKNTYQNRNKHLK